MVLTNRLKGVLEQELGPNCSHRRMEKEEIYSVTDLEKWISFRCKDCGHVWKMTETAMVEKLEAFYTKNRK